MKVGLVTTEFFPVWGGVASYCINLCKALRGKVELHVFTTSRKLDRAAPGEEGFNVFDSVKIHAISPATDIFFSSFRYQLSLVRKLPHLINENKLDLVHSAGPLADQMLRIVGNSTPHVLTYHSTLSGQRQGISGSGVRFRDLDSSEKMTLLSYPIIRLYESLSLAKTKNVIAVSKAVRDELVERYNYKGRITVIPNSIDVNTFKPDRKRADRIRVIFSGRLIALKGPQLIIKAMPQVLREHKDAVFVFAGAGRREPYRRMLQETGISEENFDFCYIDYWNMPQFYSSGDMLVLPSLLESFPMSVLEAMACGLPVVASDVGDVAELVKDGETGFLITKGDYQALAGRINQLLGDEALREEMGKNARNLVVKNYSLEMMGERTLKVYQESLEGEV